MRSAARKFAAEILFGDQTPRWLSLLGTSGAGKTFLAKAIVQATRQRWVAAQGTDHEFRYWTEAPLFHWPTIGEKMMRGQWGLMDRIIEETFCIIDELECENDSKGILTDKLCKIAERRLGKWTVFTSNLSLEGIAQKLDQRISSRMLRNGNFVVDVDVIDFNLRKA